MVLANGVRFKAWSKIAMVIAALIRAVKRPIGDMAAG